MAGKTGIEIKRVYDTPSAEDGVRILVDRLWPRGLKKDAARLDEWRKAVAPSPELRRWFNHDPRRWDEFVRRYEAELDANPEAWRDLVERAAHTRLTLLYAARDTTCNHAAALGAYLERQAAS